jgi:hypothetical protein
MDTVQMAIEIEEVRASFYNNEKKVDCIGGTYLRLGVLKRRQSIESKIRMKALKEAVHCCRNLA